MRGAVGTRVSGGVSPQPPFQAEAKGPQRVFGLPLYTFLLWYIYHLLPPLETMNPSQTQLTTRRRAPSAPFAPFAPFPTHKLRLRYGECCLYPLVKSIIFASLSLNVHSLSDPISLNSGHSSYQTSHVLGPNRARFIPCPITLGLAFLHLMGSANPQS